MKNESERARCLRLLQKEGPYSPAFHHMTLYESITQASAVRFVGELRDAQRTGSIGTSVSAPT